MTPSRLTFLYALLVAAGGVMGYIKAASVISLACGLGAAALLFICVYAMNSKWLLGYIGACMVTLILAGFFAIRFANSGFITWMPAGMMAICSLAVFVGLLLLRKRSDASG